MSAQILFIFGIFLFRGIPTFGEEVITTETSEPVTPVIERSLHHDIGTSEYRHENPTHQGFWKKKLLWRPRWVKTWQEKKVYAAVWKRMWGPAIVKEWVPVPKPPPGWVKRKGGNYFIKGY